MFGFDAIEMGHVVVVGSMNMDLVLQLERWPEPGEKVAGLGYRTVPGGKGANQAVAASRLGARVQMVGCVGQDEFGRTMTDSLVAAGVDTSAIRQASSGTGVALVGVEPGGSHRVVVVPGANQAVTERHIEDEHSALTRAGWLLLQLEIPFPTVEAAARLAFMIGTRVVLDPSPLPAQGLPRSLLRCVDILVPTLEQAVTLTGYDEPGRAAARLLEWGVGAVVITNGLDGALVVDQAGAHRIAPFTTEVVDSTGAGDAFVGGLAAALAAGMDLPAAARVAAAAGAVSATRLGAQPSLPTLAEIDALMSQVDERPPMGYPEQFIWSGSIADGREILIRPILPADGVRLKALFGRLSQETIYRRFFTTRKAPTEDEVRRLSMVDYHQELALVATLTTDPETLVGVARFAPVEEEEGLIEFAIVVEDAFQGKGIGRLLFDRLLAAAIQLGHHTLLVETQLDNLAMIALAERPALPTRREREGNLLRIYLELSPV